MSGALSPASSSMEPASLCSAMAGYLLNGVGIDHGATLATDCVFIALRGRLGERGNPLVFQHAERCRRGVEQVIVGNRFFPGVRADLRNERVCPKLRASRIAVAFNSPHAAERKERADQVQARELVGLARVV